MILEKGWFPDLEIPEICEHVNCKECAQESIKQAETQNIENQNIRELITTTSMLTEEEEKKNNVES